MNRLGYIGSSDIGCIMGVNPWKTALQLWAEKTGEIEPKDLSDNEAVEMGNELEDTVARIFTKRTGLRVRRSPKIYSGKEGHPSANKAYYKAQVDRLIEGSDELLECKTCSAWKAKDWEGEEIPASYILQVLFQLMLTGRKVGYIACLIGGQKFVYKKIEADEEMFAKMREQADAFWQMVQDRVPPATVGADNDWIISLFPTHGEAIQEVEEFNDRIGLLQQLKGTIKDAEAQKDEIEASIKAVIGDNLGLKTSSYTVTWKRQPKTSLDTKTLKEEMPEVYIKYARIGETRIMRVTKTKEKE